MRTELLPPVFGLVVINVAVALPPREQVPLHYELDRPDRTELHKRVEHNISIDNTCGFFGAGQGNSYQCNPNAGNGGLCCGPMGFCVCFIDQDVVQYADQFRETPRLSVALAVNLSMDGVAVLS